MFQIVTNFDEFSFKWHTYTYVLVATVVSFSDYLITPTLDEIKIYNEFPWQLLHTFLLLGIIELFIYTLVIKKFKLGSHNNEDKILVIKL